MVTDLCPGLGGQTDPVYWMVLGTRFVGLGEPRLWDQSQDPEDEEKASGLGIGTLGSLGGEVSTEALDVCS